MAAPVLVTGGTGTLGSAVVEQLRDRGGDVRVLSRHEHASEPGTESRGGLEYAVGDLGAGRGIDAAVRDVSVVVHCAGGPRGDDKKARTLVGALRRTGVVEHLAVISIVGIDRIPRSSALDRTMFGFYGTKVATEQVIVDSGLPHTILRATQFHDLVLTVSKALARLPVVPMPAGVQVQPVDVRDVAPRLVDLALDEPAGRAPDLGGPEIYPLRDLVRSYLSAAGIRRRLITVPLPGPGARALVTGANLTPEHADGTRTWEEFLAEHVTGR